MRAAVMDTVIGGRDDAETFARAQQIGCAGVEITARSGRPARLEGNAPCVAAPGEADHRARDTRSRAG